MTRSIFCKSDKKAIRKKIDLLDGKIIALLEKRFFLVCHLKDLKKKMTDRERENEILATINCPFIQEVYRTIFTCSKKMLKKMRG